MICSTSQIVSSGGNGEFSLALHVIPFPQSNGFVPVMVSDIRGFQAWHLDTVGLGSNFSRGLEVMFNRSERDARSLGERAEP